MPSAKTLRVYANPWHALDSEGRPAGACACDPDYHTPARKFVGATLEAKETRKAVPAKGITARHDITYAFSTEAQEIPLTVYYLEAVKRGELIAADEASAKACGFAPDTFKDPAVCLAEERRAAARQFQINYGEIPPFVTAEEVAAWDAEDKAAKERAEAEVEAKADADAKRKAKSPKGGE